MKKPKLTSDQQKALVEAIQAGTWSGSTGRPSDKPKTIDSPLFPQPKPVQASLW